MSKKSFLEISIIPSFIWFCLIGPLIGGLLFLLLKNQGFHWLTAFMFPIAAYYLGIVPALLTGLIWCSLLNIVYYLNRKIFLKYTGSVILLSIVSSAVVGYLIAQFFNVMSIPSDISDFKLIGGITGGLCGAIVISKINKVYEQET